MLLLGCTEANLEAVEPVWGKQQCSHCAMLVSEKAPAAQAVTTEGKRRFFDDIGCMVAWEQREHPRVRARWVRAGESWIDPTATRFSAGQSTPMDFGFLADSKGAVTFEEVQQSVRAKSRSEP